MARIVIDPESNLVQEYSALIYTPSRRRKRFPDNCVKLVKDEQTALAHADPDKKLHPAIVMGPSRSSEGFMLYYLVRWLS